jgi:hypothetical protein
MFARAKTTAIVTHIVAPIFTASRSETPRRRSGNRDREVCTAVAASASGCRTCRRARWCRCPSWSGRHWRRTGTSCWSAPRDSLVSWSTVF